MKTTPVRNAYMHSQPSDKNPYQNTSEKIYRWSFYVIHVVIAFAFLIVYQQEKDSLIDVIKEVFKFTKDIYYLYVIPIGLKILGEHAPAIVSAFKGGGLPLASSSNEDSATPSPRATYFTNLNPSQKRPKTQQEFIDEKNYF
jgi:hypothetical protein